MPNLFAVTASTTLNLRSSPELHADNIIRAMPNGQIVTKLEDADPPFVKVSTTLDGEMLTGFCSSEFLGPAETEGSVGTPGKFDKTLSKVSNRGRPNPDFLQELVDWGKTASSEIFIDKQTEEKDVYASVQSVLGPYGDLIHRKACMLEVMRVLAGFESSWKWSEGHDTNNPDEDSPDTFSAGPFQVSANSLAFGQDLKELVEPFGIRNAKRDGDAFQALMKTNHTVAFNYISRLLRHTIRANGPVKRSEINPFLSRDAVAEFQGFLA